MRSSVGKGAVAAPPPAGAIMICGGASSEAAATKAIDLPSGDQRGELSGPSAVEILVNAPPSAPIVQTSVLRPPSYSCPVRSETNAMRFPSGDHCGSVSFQSSPSVICLAFPLARSITHRCDRLSSYQPVSLNLYDRCE